MVLKCCSFLFIIGPVLIEQFSEMVLIIGGKTKQEEVVSDNKLVVI